MDAQTSKRSTYPWVRLSKDAFLTALALTVGILLITGLHYTTAPTLSRFHAVYRYFYFLPVVYAALRFGFWGGVLSAVMASLLFAPHIFFKWNNFPEESLNDLLVTLVLTGVAIITGITADRMRQAEAQQAATARRLAHSLEQLQAQDEELRRAERLSALGTLAGGLAHEIRNPVSIIRATAQLLGSEGDPDVLESLHVIQQETDRIERLITELVNLATPQEPKLAPTNILHLLTQVQTRLQPVAQANHVTVQVEAGPNLPQVALDSERLEQVLMQLAMNAIQALEGTPGQVTLQADWDGERPLPLELRVSDTGPGIPQALRSRIFDPFFTTKDTGMGLGLTVVQHVVADHRGRIQVDGRPDGGSTFTLCLPA